MTTVFNPDIMDPLRRQQVTRYVLPLREGGSLPALAEADDGFKYVLKFKGAGHGYKALIAEFLGGEIARQLGFRVPELVFLDVDEDFGRTEGDEEIQDLLKASRGLNIGMHFLSGALTLDPYVNPVDETLASGIVWLDAFLTNVDRTVRNTNMLVWHGEVWLIDQGASFFFHHSWGDWRKAAASPFPYIKDHALIRKATHISEVAHKLTSRLSPAFFRRLVDMIPEEWLDWGEGAPASSEIRDVYYNYLCERLNQSHVFTNEAINAHRQALI